MTDEDGTVTRVWRVGDPAIHAAVHERLARAELLIADGHHRYETARAYRDEIGGEGPHNYTLMALTGLDDPGLTVFPTHRLLSGFADDPERQQLLGNGPARALRVDRGRARRARPRRRGGRRRLRPLRLPPQAAASGCGSRTRRAELDRLLEGKSEAYRRLDAAILETVVLEGHPRDEQGRHRRQRGIGYAKSIADSLSLVEEGPYDVAFILRPTPVEQVARSREPARTCRRSRPTSSPRSSPARLQPGRLSLAAARRRMSAVVKIYTKKGDDGTTSLWYGGRVPKHHGRTEAYGALDEACSALGVARALCGAEPGGARRRHPPPPGRPLRRRRRAGDRARGGRPARGRDQPHHRGDGRGARGADRPLHGPGRAAAQVRHPRRHAALRPARRRPHRRSAAPSAASPRSARPASWPARP